MMPRSFRRASVWLCLLAISACGAPQSSVVAPAPGPPPVTRPPATHVPPPAEELESFILVRDDPFVAAATNDLAAATLPAARPGALMRRVRAAIAAARRLRSGSRGLVGFPEWATDQDRFAAFCELAIRDLDELLGSFAQAPEAAEALFAMGQVHDYPLLNLFDDALQAYRLTVELYPGSPWAHHARERIAVIVGFIEGRKSSPHGEATPFPPHEH